MLIQNKKEELLEIERRMLVEMGRRYGAHLERRVSVRQGRIQEKVRAAREAVKGVQEACGPGGGGGPAENILRSADGRDYGIRAAEDCAAVREKG